MVFGQPEPVAKWKIVPAVQEHHAHAEEVAAAGRILVLSHWNGGGDGQLAAAIETRPVASHMDHDRAAPDAVIRWSVASKSAESAN